MSRILCFVLFFFFKQKTAYEMRISDWSSDVCSSDLPGSMPGVLNQDRFAKGLAIWRKDSIADLLDRIIDRANQRYPAQQLLPAVDQGLADEVGGKHPRQEHHKQYQHDLKTRDLQAKQRLRRQKCRHKAFQCADQQGNNPNRNDQGYPDQQARHEVSLEDDRKSVV